jgi:hypothetical protein
VGPRPGHDLRGSNQQSHRPLPRLEGSGEKPHVKFLFPRYDDPRFVREVQKLVQSLGQRYDGNPALAYMRIGTGKSGEDNPYGRIGMGWFSNSLWIKYSRQVAGFYLTSFHGTRLEFDMLWTAIVVAGVPNVTPITPGEQKEAQQFIDELIDKNIFIAFNGIASEQGKRTPNATAANAEGALCPGFNPRADATTPAMDAAPLAQVARLKQRGIVFGLEGDALFDTCMAPRRLSALLDFYRPVRFVFFADAAAVINFNRQGLNDLNRDEIDALTNILVSWTNIAEFPAHQAQALPPIRQFSAGLDQLVRDAQLR